MSASPFLFQVLQNLLRKKSLACKDKPGGHLSPPPPPDSYMSLLLLCPSANNKCFVAAVKQDSLRPSAFTTHFLSPIPSSSIPALFQQNSQTPRGQILPPAHSIVSFLNTICCLCLQRKLLPFFPVPEAVCHVITIHTQQLEGKMERLFYWRQGNGRLEDKIVGCQHITLFLNYSSKMGITFDLSGFYTNS